ASAIGLKPGRYAAYLNLAHVHLAQKSLERAAEQERIARQLRAPPSALAGYHVERARVLLLDSRHEEALRECESALRLSADEPRGHDIRGRALLALGRYEQAERAFGQCLRGGGEESTDLFRRRGHARTKLGKYPDAVEDYTRALELAPDADIFRHRGWAY